MRGTTATVLVLLLLLAVQNASGQVLNGDVRSVTTFDTCTNSPLASDPKLAQTVLSTLQNDLSGNLDKTPCGILGEDTPITAVTLFLQTNEVSGGENLVFTIPNIPNDPNGSNTNSAGECSGTLEGTDCQILMEPLVITFETSNAVNVWNLYKTMLPIPYGMVWEQADSVQFPRDGTPATNTPYHTMASTESCSTLMNNGATLEDDGNPFTSTPNAGPVGKSQQRSVCPTQAQLEGDANTLGFEGAAQFFPDYQYNQINPTCNILACPSADEETGDYIWRYGYLAALEPVCSAFRIQESPRTLINVEVLLQTGTANTTLTDVGQLTLSSLNDGGLVPDTSGTVLGALVNLETPVGFVGQPLGGGIITCGTCISPTEQGEEPGICTYGLLSDISASDIANDGIGIETRNPWKTPEGLNAVAQGCNVPTQTCRRLLLDNEEEQGSWYYVNDSEWVRMFGTGCSKNGMSTDVFIKRPEVAELMCAGGMNGACVPGYQQTTLGSDFTSITPCENFLTQAQQLFAQSQGAKVSFSGVPIDYNPAEPPYWVDKTHILREPTSSGTIQEELVLYLGGNFVGEGVGVATGVLLNSTLLCAAPQNNAAGEVFALVQNTGATAGSFIVKTNFGTATTTNTTSGATSFSSLDGGTVVVSDVTDCTISLEPNQIGACTIPFAYAGPIDPDLVVELSLFSGTVVSGRDQVSLGTTQVQCFITAETGGGQTFGTVDISNFVGDRDDADLSDDDSDNNDTCYFWQTWPWPNRCTPDSVIDWVARIGYWLTLLLLAALGLGIMIYSCINVSWMNKIRKLQKQISSKSAISATQTLLATSTLFLCLVCSVEARDSSSLSSSSFVPATPVTSSSSSSTFTSMGIWNVILGNIALYVPLTILSFIVIALVIAYRDRIEIQKWLMARRRRVLSVRTMSTGVLPLLALTCLCVSAQVNILSVSSFRECVFTGGADNSTGLNCATSEFATTMNLEIFAPSNGESSANFNVALSTVPNQNSDEVQIGSGTRCPADTPDKCQTSTPATISITSSEPVLIYELNDVTGSDEGQFFIPYNYLYLPVATAVGTTDDQFTGAVEDLLDSSIYHNVQCKFQSFFYTTGEISFAGTDQVSTTYFTNERLNEQMLRCPMNAQPPFNPTTEQKAEGALHYEFLCTYDRESAQCDGGQCQVNVEYSAAFEPLGPFCRLYHINNPPSVGVNIDITISTPITSESIEIQSVTRGVEGATAISQPSRLVSATILQPLNPDGLVGPDVQGYIVVCNSDPENPGVLEMVTSGNLANNPWDSRPTQDDGFTCPFNGEPYPEYPTSEPCGLSFLFPDDPWAMWYYVRPGLTPTYGPGCGQNGYAADGYSNPNPVLQFNSLLRTNGATLPIQQLLPSTQCFGLGTEDEACGSGEISNTVTCVPGFGIGFLDLDTKTPCTIMSELRDASDTMVQLNASDGPNAARSFRVPNTTPQWNNPDPNEWLRDRSLYVKPITDATGFQVLLTFAGELIDYPQEVTNADLETGGASGTFCSMDVTGTAFSGAAYYKVCNEDRQSSIGNYNLAVDCGYVRDYDQITDTFTEVSVLVSPPSMLIAGVEAGTCRTANTDAPFLLEFLGSTTNTTSQDPIQCNYKLFSAETVNPSDVELSRVNVVCTTDFEPTFVLNGETLGVPDTLTPVIDPSTITDGSTDDTDTDDGDELNTAGKVVVWLVIGSVLFLALAFALFMCIYSIRQKNNTKKIMKETGG